MPTVAESPSERHRVIPEKRPEMLKANLRKSEDRDFQAEIGACLYRARHWLGWSLKELAAHLSRDERQVRRWEAGEERPQVDVIFSVEELREPFCVQLAKLSGAEVYMRADFRKVG